MKGEEDGNEMKKKTPPSLSNSSLVYYGLFPFDVILLISLFLVPISRAGMFSSFYNHDNGSGFFSCCTVELLSDSVMKAHIQHGSVFTTLIHATKSSVAVEKIHNLK